MGRGSFSKMKAINLVQVIDGQICSGCGLCASGANEAMEAVAEVGMRPKSVDDRFLESCPGAGLDRKIQDISSNIDKDMYEMWGPVLEVWQGYATDKLTRYQGSSGGVLTALATFAVEEGLASGVLHTGSSEDNPVLNETKYSRTKSDIIANTGSRYLSSSPCDGLNEIKAEEGKSVFIGKPCDSAALLANTKIDDELSRKVLINLSFCCAGTPSIQGNKKLIESRGIDNNKVEALKYRGEGWPGLWSVSDGQNKETLTYEESWGFLQKYRQWRCYVCPDHTGEFSDIACGDAWHEKNNDNSDGLSIIIVRTERGREFLKNAVANGYVELVNEDKTMLPRSQSNLFKANSQLWGRLLAMRVIGCVTPDYKGYSLFKMWALNLNFKEKLQSVFGTAKRLYKKEIYRARLKREK